MRFTKLAFLLRQTIKKKIDFNSYSGRKSSTNFLKVLQRIFSYFSKIKFSKFHKKDILPVIVIFVLDLIKTSI